MQTSPSQPGMGSSMSPSEMFVIDCSSSPSHSLGSSAYDQVGVNSNSVRDHHAKEDLVLGPGTGKDKGKGKGKGKGHAKSNEMGDEMVAAFHKGAGKGAAVQEKGASAMLPPNSLLQPAFGKSGESKSDESQTLATQAGEGALEQQQQKMVSKLGKWTEEEYGRFLEGVKMYGRQWSKVRHLMVSLPLSLSPSLPPSLHFPLTLSDLIYTKFCTT